MDGHLRESTVQPPRPAHAADLQWNDPCVVYGTDGVAHPLPAELVEVLRFAAEAFTDGCALTLTRHEQLLTTQEAADLLGVSRPTVVRLLDHGAIPYDQPGSHRRLRLADVLAHQARCHHEDPAAPR